MTTPRSSEVDALFHAWVPPVAGDRSWEPLPGLKPYSGQWAPVLDQSQTATMAGPLSDVCIQQIRGLWTGQSVVSAEPGLGCAEHLHCYAITYHRSWKPWRTRHSNATAWWCSSLQEAAGNYSWTEYWGGSFEQLAAALQMAIHLGNELYCNVICRLILDWGGVLHRPEAAQTAWLDAATSDKSLIQQIRTATQALRPDALEDLDAVFRPAGKVPMTAGTTKIFAAAAMDFSRGWDAPEQDVLILDGRVGAALGLLARRLGGSLVPEDLRFPWEVAGGKNGYRQRNPSCPHVKFPKMSQITDAQRARFARTAAQCIVQAVGRQSFLEAERALFMIGYDVSACCNHSPRMCQHAG